MMKKLFKYLSVILLCGFMMSGCANNEVENEPTTEETWEDQLIQKGTISIGISPDYPPYEYYDESNTMVGYDVDMMNELAKLLGDYELEWVEMSFDNIISSIQLGQVDLGVAGFTYDPDRQVLFSDPYLKSAQVVLVNEDSDIQTLDDLKGKLVGVQMGTTGESAVSEIEGVQLHSVSDAKLLVETLKVKSIDAVVMDRAVANNYVENTTGFRILDEALIDEENMIIANTNKDLLIEKINEVIAQFDESDAATQLKEKWGL